MGFSVHDIKAITFLESFVAHSDDINLLLLNVNTIKTILTVDELNDIAREFRTVPSYLT